MGRVYKKLSLDLPRDELRSYDRERKKCSKHGIFSGVNVHFVRTITISFLS